MCICTYIYSTVNSLHFLSLIRGSIKKKIVHLDLVYRKHFILSVLLAPGEVWGPRLRLRCVLREVKQ